MAYDQDYTGTPENDIIDIPTEFPDLVNLLKKPGWARHQNLG